MFHVPDVNATVAWYRTVGFDLRATHATPCGATDWASMTLGGSEVMFSSGGRTAPPGRRDVDLYIRVEDLEAAFRRIAPWSEIVEGLHTTHHGMREFIVRDLNGFWLTFGQETATR